MLNATGPTGAYVGVPACVVKPPVKIGVFAVMVKGVEDKGEVRDTIVAPLVA